MLWILFSVMALAALVAVAWPLYRTEQRIGGAILVVVLVVGIGSLGLYQVIGEPGAITAPMRASTTPEGDPADVDEMVDTLAERLAANPDDVDGWKMLGRSYGVMRRYPEAIDALERAVALENSSNAQTVVDLGEVVFMGDSQTLLGRAGELFESALTLEPANPKAMFYAGLAAAERGNTMLAAERWQTLLDTGPPAEIETVLRARIATWRGETQPQAPAPAVASASGEGISLTVSISLSTDAQELAAAGGSLFVIARDPARPAPPIAVARRPAGELPLTLTLTDSDAMIPGRLLSGTRNLEIIARVSASGEPIAQSGDWFASQTIDSAEQRELDLVVDQQVP